MNMLPEDILNKIMLYNSHPIADMLKESTIFNYIRLLEKLNSDRGDIDLAVLFVDDGCDAAYCGEEYGFDFDMLCEYYHSRLDHSNMEKCLYSYNLGYMHTMMNVDDEEHDNIINNEYNYTIKVINDVPDIEVTMCLMFDVIDECLENADDDGLENEVTWSDSDA